MEVVIRSGGDQRTEKAVGGMTEPRKVVCIKAETEKLSESDPQNENPEEGDTEPAPPYPINKSASKATLAPDGPEMSFPKKMSPQRKKRKPISAIPVSSPLPQTPSIPSSSSTPNQSTPASLLHIPGGDYSHSKWGRLLVHRWI